MSTSSRGTIEEVLLRLVSLRPLSFCNASSVSARKAEEASYIHFSRATTFLHFSNRIHACRVPRLVVFLMMLTFVAENDKYVRGS